MSVEAVVARVEQLQQLFSAATAPGGNGGQDFASQLTAATSAAQPATAVAPAAPAGSTLALSGATGGTSALPPGVPYGAEITAAARKHGIDPALLAGLVRQESNFNPTAGSPAGARGLTQLMPGTAAGLGVTDVTDPVQALDGGAKYLKQQLDAFGGDVTKALAAYNAGPGAVQRYGGVPPYAETQNYVQKVQAFAAAYRGTPTGTASAVPPAASTSLPYSIV
jgi:soluble lytic murein transglycosylase-like protein